jgi:hypothetical protein
MVFLCIKSVIKNENRRWGTASPFIAAVGVTAAYFARWKKREETLIRKEKRKRTHPAGPSALISIEAVPVAVEFASGAYLACSRASSSGNDDAVC